MGNPPGPITNIVVSGPSGVVAEYPGDGWDPVPSQWPGYFGIFLPGSPAPGLYRFTARTASSAGLAVDHQYAIRFLPAFDEKKISPADGVVFNSKTPSFTWALINYQDDPNIALYYRFEIWDVDAGTRVFATRLCSRHELLHLAACSYEPANARQNLQVAGTWGRWTGLG